MSRPLGAPFSAIGIVLDSVIVSVITARYLRRHGPEIDPSGGCSIGESDMTVHYGSAKGTWPFSMNASEMKNLVFKLCRYGISGASATFTHISLLYLFTDICRIYYLFSTSMAFVCAFFVSFSLQKYWTFRDRDNTRVKKQMGLFLFIAITNLCLNGLGMKTMVDFVGMNHLVSQAIVSLGIAAWSYFAYSFIFKTK